MELVFIVRDQEDGRSIPTISSQNKDLQQTKEPKSAWRHAKRAAADTYCQVAGHR
jgi:hypothetical protein